MTARKRPGAAEELMRLADAVDAAAAGKPGGTNHRTRPVRVTLDLDPVMHAALARWANDAGSITGRTRVSLADALRAMITVITGDEAPSCSARVLAELRRERE